MMKQCFPPRLQDPCQLFQVGGHCSWFEVHHSIIAIRRRKRVIWLLYRISVGGQYGHNSGVASEPVFSYLDRRRRGVQQHHTSVYLWDTCGVSPLPTRNFEELRYIKFVKHLTKNGIAGPK